MVEMVEDDISTVARLNTELYNLHSQGAEAVSIQSCGGAFIVFKLLSLTLR